MAVAADRSPWFVSPAQTPSVFAAFVPDLLGHGGTAQMARYGNAVGHQRDGQNVLFLDGRVTFETRSYCGVEQDNIYTPGTTDGGHPKGTKPTLTSVPLSEMDSLLVHDPIFFAGM